MSTSTSFETCFPITDAMLSIPLDQIEETISTLLAHGVNFEQKEREIYTLYFPQGTVSIMLIFTDPQQHRIVFPDGFFFLLVDPLQEHEHSIQEGITPP